MWDNLIRNNNKSNYIWTKIHLTIFISIPYILYINIHSIFCKAINSGAAPIVVKTKVTDLEQSLGIYSDQSIEGALPWRGW